MRELAEFRRRPRQRRADIAAGQPCVWSVRFQTRQLSFEVLHFLVGRGAHDVAGEVFGFHDDFARVGEGSRRGGVGRAAAGAQAEIGITITLVGTPRSPPVSGINFRASHPHRVAKGRAV